MAGKIKANTVQLGDSATATQNFVLKTNVDGTAILARGNDGATSQDILAIDASGNVNASVAMQQGGVAMPRMVTSTSVPTTSGTTIDITGIPSWAKRITVMFKGVSTSGTANILLQIGSGSVVATGYLSLATNNAQTAATTGFIIVGSPTAAALQIGTVVLNLMESNLWIETGVVSPSAAGIGGACSSTGYLSLGGALDRIRLTTSGTDTFDAGSINIMYEG